jgi:hypothetical protein
MKIGLWWARNMTNPIGNTRIKDKFLCQPKEMMKPISVNSNLFLNLPGKQTQIQIGMYLKTTMQGKQGDHLHYGIHIESVEPLRLNV